MQLFQAGAFTADEANNVGSILAVWVLSLPFYAGYMYMYRVFAALRSFLKFAPIDFAVRFAQVAGYWYLCQPDVLGLAGIPVADLGFYAVMFVVCSFIVRGKVGKAVAIAALWLWWSKRLLPVWLVLWRQACLLTVWVLFAGVAISAVVKAIAILAVSWASWAW